MVSFEVTVKDPMGLHARPAGELVKEAKKYASTITVVNGGRSAQAGRLIALMGLGITSGTTVTVQVEGPDENECAEGMKAFFENMV